LGAYLLLSIVIMSIIVLPWIGLIYPFILVSIMIMFKLSIAATKEVARVESVTKSPLLSFLQESISGASTIRAFECCDEFIAKNNELLNKNILASQWAESVPIWFAVRIDLLSILTLLSVSSICVLYRFRGNSIMLSLLMTYVL